MIYFHKTFDRTLVSPQQRNESELDYSVMITQRKSVKTFNGNLSFKMIPVHIEEACENVTKL